MSKSKQIKDINELKWVRLYSPTTIPKYLVEQVRDREFTVDDFYKYQEINCLVDEGKGVSLNPLNHLYALVDPQNIVKGFLWFVVDSLSKDIVINTYSVDNEYWGGGRAVKLLYNHIIELMKRFKLDKVYWLTNYPKHSERYGFKRARSVLMEYTEKPDGKPCQGKHKTQEKHQSVDAGTATVDERDTDSSRTGIPGNLQPVPSAPVD